MSLSGREFRARSGKTGYVVLVAALVAVSLGAIAIAVHGIMGLGEETRPRLRQKLHLMCSQCGYRFYILPRDFARQWKDVTDYEPKDVGKIHCPECKARFSCSATTLCPHCGKDFLEDPAASVNAGAGDEPKRICPHCKKEL